MWQGSNVVVVMDEAHLLRLRQGSIGENSDDVDEGSDLFLSPLDDVPVEEYRRQHHHESFVTREKCFRQINHYGQFSVGDVVNYPALPRVDLSLFRKGHRLLIDDHVPTIPQRITLIFRRGLFFIGGDYRPYLGVPRCPYLVHYRQLCQLNGLRPQPLPLGPLGRVRRPDGLREGPRHHYLFRLFPKKQ
jgi:hypothetical protein